MSADFFASKIQCSREAKQECLITVRHLVELAFAARTHGLLKMDDLIADRFKYADPFLRKAVALIVDTSNLDNIRKVLMNYIVSSNYLTGEKFLRATIITEVMLAVGASEDLDYIFSYLVPSYFGLDYEEAAVSVYKDFKKQMLDGHIHRM